MSVMPSMPQSEEAGEEGRPIMPSLPQSEEAGEEGRPIMPSLPQSEEAGEEGRPIMPSLPQSEEAGEEGRPIMSSMPNRGRLNTGDAKSLVFRLKVEYNEFLKHYCIYETGRILLHYV